MNDSIGDVMNIIFFYPNKERKFITWNNWRVQIFVVNGRIPTWEDLDL